jgi:hypothetical protein
MSTRYMLRVIETFVRMDVQALTDHIILLQNYRT